MVKRKLTSILLAVAMLFTYIPNASYAVESKPDPVTPVVIAKAIPSGKKVVKVSWLKTEGATKYIVYGNLYGKKFKKLKTLDETKRSFKIKKIGKNKLKRNKIYSFYVSANKTNEKGELQEISKSKTCTVVVSKTTKNKKYSYAKSILIKNKVVKMERGEVGTATKLAGISSKMYKKKKHLAKKYGDKYTYIVLNKENKVDDSVLTIDKAGNISIKKDAKVGTKETVYVQELNGAYNTFEVIVVTAEEAKEEATEQQSDGSGGGGGGGQQDPLAQLKTQFKNLVAAEAQKATTSAEAINGVASANAKQNIKNKITEIKTTAETAINNATSSAEASAAADLAIAKLEAIEELISALSDTPSEEELEALEEAVDKIEDETNPDNIGDIVDDGKTAMEDASKYVTVKFYPNGGAGDPYTQKIQKSVLTALSANAFTAPDGGVDITDRPIGGRIFYVDTSASSGVTYTFKDASGNELPTDVNGLSEAATYSASGGAAEFKGWTTSSDGTGTPYYADGANISADGDIDLYAQWGPQQDKFYVVATNSSDGKPVIGRDIQWGAHDKSVGITTDGIGKGKPNTAKALANSWCFKDNPNGQSETGSNTIWTWLKDKRDNNLNGYNDWFIPSTSELVKLRESDIEKSYIIDTIKGSMSLACVWSSVEKRDTGAYRVSWSTGSSGGALKYYDSLPNSSSPNSSMVWGCVAARAF